MTDRTDQHLGQGQRYTRVAILLHWLIAACILFNLLIGYFMEGFEQPWRMLTVQAHMSAGISVIVLTVLRVIWRLLHSPPPHPPGLKRWERHMAHFTHFLLYALMVVMPLTGWAIISANPAPGTAGEIYDIKTKPKPPPSKGRSKPLPPRKPGQPIVMNVWGLVPLPMIAPIQAIGEQPGGVPAQRILHDKFIEWHAISSYLMIALIFLHVAGALKHQLLDREPELARMGIGRRRRRSGS